MLSDPFTQNSAKDHATGEMELNAIANVVRDNALIYRLNIDPKHFAIAEYGELWGMLQAAIRQGQTITPFGFRAFLGNHLGMEETGRMIASIAIEGGWAIHEPETYGRNLRLEYQRRKARQTATNLAEDLNGAAPDIAAAIVGAVQDLRNGMEVRELADTVEVHRNILAELDKPVKAYRTGMDCFDHITMGGLQAGMFYGIGGRFKAGKSFMLTTISHNMLATCRHAYLTLESNKEQLYKRMLARTMGINTNAFLDPKNRQNATFRQHVVNAQDNLKTEGFYMQTMPRMDLATLRSTLEQAVIKHGIEGAMVDYLQLVGGDPKVPKALHYEDVAQTLAELTREFGIWLVAAAQMNAEGNVRWGEGLLMACDMALVLNRCDENEPGIENGDCWLEMRASRYTTVENAGAPDNPALRLNARVGPYFESLTTN